MRTTKTLGKVSFNKDAFKYYTHVHRPRGAPYCALRMKCPTQKVRMFYVYYISVNMKTNSSRGEKKAPCHWFLLRPQSPSPGFPLSDPSSTSFNTQMSPFQPPLSWLPWECSGYVGTVSLCEHVFLTPLQFCSCSLWSTIFFTHPIYNTWQLAVRDRDKE